MFFYELGLAHALAKPAILVAESMEDVPFDLRALRVLVYDKNAPNWGSILQQKVKSSIEEVLKSPVESVLPAFLDTKGTSPKTTLTQHEREMLEMKQQIELLRDEFNRTDQFRNSRSSREMDSREIDIGPGKARDMIEVFVSSGAKTSEIIRRMSGFGPPPDWILKTTNEVRRESRQSKGAGSERSE